MLSSDDAHDRATESDLTMPAGDESFPEAVRTEGPAQPPPDVGLAAQLLEAAPDAILVIATDGRIVLANAQAERLFGIARAELLGQPVDRLLPESLRERHRGHRLRYLETPRTRPMGVGLELVGRRWDGTTFPVEISLSPLWHAGGLWVTAVVRDITSRTQQAARERFLARATSLLAQSIDYQTTVLQAAKLTVPDLADYAAVDLLDDDGRLRRLGMAHRNPTEHAALQAVLAEQPLVLARETPFTAAVRARRTVHLATVSVATLEAVAENQEHLQLLRRLSPHALLLVPLVGRERAVGLLVLGATAPGRHYEAEDVRLAEALAARMAQAIEHSWLYRQAQAAVAARDIFLSTISHDLRNPLSAIKMAEQFLGFLAEEDRLTTADILDVVSTIDHAVNQADTMVEQLLDLARMQSGRGLALQRQPTDLVAVAHAVLAEQQRRTRRHQLSVQSAIPRLEGHWDRRRLERVLTNLVGNAVKYSPDGGAVRLHLAVEEERWATLLVEDHGLGIPAEDLPRLFERFHRGRNVVDKIAGTGVGLASAKQIVEAHGGSLVVESTEHVGTRVQVRLPLSRPKEDRR